MIVTAEHECDYYEDLECLIIADIISLSRIDGLDSKAFALLLVSPGGIAEWQASLK